MDKKQRTKAFEAIAKEHLFIDTLKTRKRDSLDFHDVSVWGVQSALEEAFQLGQTIGVMKGIVTEKRKRRKLEK